MPQTQRGQVYRLGPNRWGLRYYDVSGARRRKSPFPSKSAALAHYRDVIEPQLRGDRVGLPDLTLAEFVPLYLERHAAGVRSRTVVTLRERLPHATAAFGAVLLRDLEDMSGELATWQAKLPERSRYGIVQALRQALEAAVRWGYMCRNPAKLAGRNRQPSPRTVRAFTRDELAAIALELSPRYQPLPEFAAATGLRPEEWRALERRDIDSTGASPQPRANGLRWRDSRTGKDQPKPPPGASLPTCTRCARRSSAAVGHPLLVSGPDGRTAQPRSLQGARVAARHQSERRAGASEDLRPPRDVRIPGHPRRRTRVRTRQDHGYERPHDRAPLRLAARRRGRRDRKSTRRIRRRRKRGGNDGLIWLHCDGLSWPRFRPIAIGGSVLCQARIGGRRKDGFPGGTVREDSQGS